MNKNVKLVNFTTLSLNRDTKQALDAWINNNMDNPKMTSYDTAIRQLIHLQTMKKFNSSGEM